MCRRLPPVWHSHPCLFLPLCLGSAWVTGSLHASRPNFSSSSGKASFSGSAAVTPKASCFSVTSLYANHYPPYLRHQGTGSSGSCVSFSCVIALAHTQAGMAGHSDRFLTSFDFVNWENRQVVGSFRMVSVNVADTSRRNIKDKNGLRARYPLQASDYGDGEVKGKEPRPITAFWTDTCADSLRHICFAPPAWEAQLGEPPFKSGCLTFCSRFWCQRDGTE